MIAEMSSLGNLAYGEYTNGMYRSSKTTTQFTLALTNIYVQGVRVSKILILSHIF